MIRLYSYFTIEYEILRSNGFTFTLAFRHSSAERHNFD